MNTRPVERHTLETQLPRYQALINEALERLLPALDADAAQPALGQTTNPLSEAMRYSLLAPGKRLRPAMLLAAAEMLGGGIDLAMPTACALEMIHCYSLIHDDLPGMDDDVLRRGRPTNHVVFGVGQAILAGDGLLNFAFETMLDAAFTRPEAMAEQVSAMREIARGAGVTGMIAGQSMDLHSEHLQNMGIAELNYIHANKTARLFIAAMRAAACLCGASEADMSALSAYGRAFGLLFQTVDDLLDATGDQQTVGKTLGKDEREGKLTIIRLYGIGGAQQLCTEYLQEGVSALDPFEDRAWFLRELIVNTASRQS